MSEKIKKIKELIEGWEITQKSEVVKRTGGEDYAEGYKDGLETCLNLLQSGEQLESN